ncbi:protein-glucosylgalactosylhydroxylysine glucosidase-like isoform X1 [Ptychodera flava]|uniref:protein-glucosylgalactosylhydroxylysine glucosidase-like isoform X1 n=1 Tax=Ptychodera flava TaxID=63121 RepID=UPI00396A10F6
MVVARVFTVAVMSITVLSTKVASNPSQPSTNDVIRGMKYVGNLKNNNKILPYGKEDGSRDHFIRKQSFIDAAFQKDDFGILLNGKPIVENPVLHFEEVLKDTAGEPTVFHTDKLPSNPRYMASVGNGFLSTVVYGDTVYMNGVYNGAAEHSHRARIPSTGAITVSLPAAEGDNSADKNESYALDVGKGVFFHCINTSTVSVLQRTYAHQYLTRLLINEIIVTRRKQSSNPITVNLNNNYGPESNDFDFKKKPVQEGIRSMSGPIRTPETSSAGKPEVFVYWTDMPQNITLPESEQTQRWTFLTSMALDDGAASKFYKLGMEIAPDTDVLFQSHVGSWSYKWNRGKIDVEGNLYLSQAIYGSMYYILSSLPPLLTDQSFEFPFYGLSPGGLAQGALGADYQGHVFWDMETWMYPTMLMFYPSLAKKMLLYRTLHLDAAKANAKDFGCTGAKFPWESAYTGLEVDPAPDTRDYEQHITGDIAFAIQQYIAATNDIDFIAAKRGFDTVESIAEFWKCRAKWNATRNKYEIHDVMGPDEYHQNVNNSVYTNIVAQISLQLPYYAAKFINASVPPEWKDIADKMYIPFDEEKQYHPEYDSYTNGTVVKQADVILLGFPLLINMSETVRRNDLTYYEEHTDSHGPAMTWGMFTIGWLELGEIDKANSFFSRSFANIQEPFKVWTEVSDGSGAINFCTGMGGFLQAVLFGYGGFRLYQDSLDFNPVLPPNTTGFNITGINYLGSSMDFVIKTDFVVVTLTEQTKGSPELTLVYNGKQIPLQAAKPVQIGRGKAKIAPSKMDRRDSKWKKS